MRAVAFIGPVQITSSEAATVRRAVECMSPADVFISGARPGTDTIATMTAIDLHPDAEHRVFVPVGAWHNEELVTQLRSRGATIIESGWVRTSISTWAVRDKRMLAECTVLMAFHFTRKEQFHSDAWNMIRHARRLRLGIRFFPLSGGPPPPLGFLW